MKKEIKERLNSFKKEYTKNPTEWVKDAIKRWEKILKLAENTIGRGGKIDNLARIPKVEKYF